MRLLLITQYYPPELGAAANRVSAFARLWSDDGHEVEVLTGLPNHPDGVLRTGYRPGRRQEAGTPVIRSWLLPAAAGSFARRTVGQLTFMVSGLVAALRHATRPDVVVVSTPGFFSIFTGFALRWRWSCPLVLDVRDLWPGFARTYGIVKPAWILIPFEALERWAYRHADLITTVSDGFADQIVAAGGRRARVRVIPNGADVHLESRSDDVGSADGVLIDLRSDLIDFRSRDDRPPVPIVGYLGNHGRVHDLDTLVTAAGQLGPDEIHLVLVGDGPVKEQAKAKAEAAGFGNVTWLDPVPRDQVAAMLSQFDVCVSTVADLPALGAAIPAKIFDYFLARKPVVASAVGEQAERIAALGGIVCAPGDPETLASAITDAVRTRSDVDVERSRELVLQHYGRPRLAAEAASEIAALVRSGD